mgnify:CR=1 FL=1
MRAFSYLLVSAVLAVPFSLSAALPALAEGTITVMGEASIPATPDMATVSLGVTTEGKTAADAIIRAFRGLQPDTDVVINSACYSPITASTASWLTALYQHDASIAPAGGYVMVGGAPSEAAGPTSDNYSDMNKWFSTLMTETFA